MKIASQHQHHEKDSHPDRKDTTKNTDWSRYFPYNIPTLVESDGYIFIKFVKPVVA